MERNAKYIHVVVALKKMIWERDEGHCAMHAYLSRLEDLSSIVPAKVSKELQNLAIAAGN